MEAISDSFSTISQENNHDQSRLEELKSQSQIQNEIKDDPLNYQTIHVSLFPFNNQTSHLRIYVIF